jgi:hypothetical protein
VFFCYYCRYCRPQLLGDATFSIGIRWIAHHKCAEEKSQLEELWSSINPHLTISFFGPFCIVSVIFFCLSRQFLLKGQCHEMDISFEGLNILISYFGGLMLFKVFQ